MKVCAQQSVNLALHKFDRSPVAPSTNRFDSDMKEKMMRRDFIYNINEAHLMSSNNSPFQVLVEVIIAS